MGVVIGVILSLVNVLDYVGKEGGGFAVARSAKYDWTH